MLRTLRIIVALFTIVAITLIFVDFTGTAVGAFGWLARYQFIPALLSVNIIAILVLVALVLIFGRLYCSIICPLGIFQDVVSRLRSWIMPKQARRGRFAYTPAAQRLRTTVLITFIVLIIIGLITVLGTLIASLIEPYSAYGRIASQIFAPVYDGVNNMLANEAEARGSYMFYKVVHIVSIPVLVVAIFTLVTVVVFAWSGGRDYCNKICPVGTILGYLSRFSLLKIHIDKSKCNGCKKCARHCKSSCINPEAHAVDHSRCVACFDCIGQCRQGAIAYTWRRESQKVNVSVEGLQIATEVNSQPSCINDKPQSASRRSFIAIGGFVTGALVAKAAEKTVDGGLTPLKNKKPINRATPILPPGAMSLHHLSAHCTACQLCVQNCPERVIVPSTSLDTFMQPRLDYTDSFCRPECTRCSNVCPAGALHPLDFPKKASLKVGTAVVNFKECISAADGVPCGNCARHCPASAIDMIEDEETLNMRPIVNDNICIGCGVCEYHCPVGTLVDSKSVSSAIHVEGVEIQRTI